MGSGYRREVPPHGRREVGDQERLAQEAVRGDLCRDAVRALYSAEDDDEGVSPSLEPVRVQEFTAIDAGHVEVEEDEIGTALAARACGYAAHDFPGGQSSEPSARVRRVHAGFGIAPGAEAAGD